MDPDDDHALRTIRLGHEMAAAGYRQLEEQGDAHYAFELITDDLEHLGRIRDELRDRTPGLGLSVAGHT